MMDLGFRSAGCDVTIYPSVKVIHPENISLGSHIIIDDFVFIGSHRKLIIGNYVHIASHVSVIGGGECLLGDFCGIATGARILSGTDAIDGGRLLGPEIPEEFRSVARGRVIVGAHAMVFANAVVLPDVRIGEGAVAAAGTVVTRDLEPWTVYAGVPARPLRSRASESVLRAECELLARHEPPLVRYRDESALREEA